MLRKSRRKIGAKDRIRIIAIVSTYDKRKKPVGSFCSFVHRIDTNNVFGS